uniref:Uncharacterized protein n=1 Tax=Mola mola TaxID=94237 RepID=A0A3Q4AH88_MOLML
MMFPGHSPHLFTWKRLGKTETSGEKVSVACGSRDILPQLQVEMASEFAVSEAFAHKKPHTGATSLAPSLQRSDQLRDHDDTYSEAQVLLSDWLSSKLQLVLETDEDDDPVSSPERRSPQVLANAQPAAMNYTNFDDMYKCLMDEEESSAVNSLLQALMEREVLDCAAMEELALDVGQTRKKFPDPIITMEARHLHVRHQIMQRRLRERDARQNAKEEARGREQSDNMRKKKEALRQEKTLQQEMVRLRRQMQERRCREQLIRQRYPQHFSGWLSVVLDRRLRMEKAMALYDWKRKLRAWQVWRAVVWAEQKQREVVTAEQELRAENRQCQLAVESDRKRLLRGCLTEWQQWCRMEKEQRELLAQQQETRRKMAALINAVSAASGPPAYQPVIAPTEASHQPGTTEKFIKEGSTPVGTVVQLTQPWQVTRQHAAPSAPQLQEARQRAEGRGFSGPKNAASPVSRFERRCAAQQQIITQQRKLLKEQQEQIAQLSEERSMMGLELEMEKTSQLTQLSMQRESRPRTRSSGPAEMEAAEEQRQREREEEKRKAAEKRKEEKRQEREREEEKQRQLKRQQELLKLARQHYHRRLLLQRGLAPWRHLIQLRQANMKLAENHHSLSLLRRCALGWQQSAKEFLSERETSVDQLHRHFLLRRSLSCWKRLKDWRMIQEERAERLYRARTLRRFLRALLDHVTQERLVERDHQELAQQHNNRRALWQCFLAWRKLPCVLRKEREREGRRWKLGRKVAEVLPDFCPYPP